MADETVAPEQDHDVARPGLRQWIWMPMLTVLLAALVVLVGRHTFVA